MLGVTVTHAPTPPPPTSPQMRDINHSSAKLESKKRNRAGYFGEPLITQLLVLDGTVEMWNPAETQTMVMILKMVI